MCSEFGLNMQILIICYTIFFAHTICWGMVQHSHMCTTEYVVTHLFCVVPCACHTVCRTQWVFTHYWTQLWYFTNYSFTFEFSVFCVIGNNEIFKEVACVRHQAQWRQNCLVLHNMDVGNISHVVPLPCKYGVCSTNKFPEHQLRDIQSFQWQNPPMFITVH